MPVSPSESRSSFLTLKDMVRSAMRQNPGAACILAPSRQTLSFQGLSDHTCLVEAQLRAAGIGPGDCIASALPNGADSVGAFLTLASSCLYAPLNPDDDGKALDFAFAHLTPTAVVLRDGDSTPARGAAERAGIRVLELRTRSEYEAGRCELTIPDLSRDRGNCESGGRAGAPDPNIRDDRAAEVCAAHSRQPVPRGEVSDPCPPIVSCRSLFELFAAVS